MKYEALRDDVVDACRGLAASGLGGYIGGHVSIRVPGEQLYLTNVLDLSLDEMTREDILLLDFDGQVVEGNRAVSPGIGFHDGIYKLRSDINSIVHTHSIWITAQSAFSRPPKLWHNMSTYFHNRTAVCPDESIEVIGPALGDDNIAIIMPWHGSITVGKSIAEASALHVTFDYVCHLDVLLQNSTAPEMPEDWAHHMQTLLGKADYLERTWNLMKRKAAKTGYVRGG
jgi:L-fuculose-phosphate aldolase